MATNRDKLRRSSSEYRAATGGQRAPSVTFDAGGVAIIYTGDHQAPLPFCSFSQAQFIPLNAGGHDTHSRPLDPFSGVAGHGNLRVSV
jgi:hypothetical protein